MHTLTLNYPAELPVSEHRSEILAALRQSAVVIVSGDTGSGKTTQLPKMALEYGKEVRHGAPTHRRIACTQPRRLAAVTMAERVAAELGGEVGGLVGYRHRFGRRISSATRIEFMTDGVLLAETRFDPLLRAYDTIIVDEAHERSLNIDFLLGILKRILAKRRDLKVIVSSATLDAARFSAFFGDAPAVLVPGRLFPIEIGYRPPPEDEERDLAAEIVTAVAELPADGDILVFLPGERDIRETAERLTDARGATDEIIPLLASLPAAEQRRAFRTSSRRRIILATNVAETSVTIPGIRAVIDSGLARISRYLPRTQIQRLQIEPISQASARQRAGRCGRLGPGVCLRLYSEEDFSARDAYTPPEVLRSSLAGVILTMLDLGLGDITSFPFIDPPKPTAVREGLRELLELGAVGHDKDGERMVALTPTGRKLARIPVEPRFAKMLLAASENGVLPSVLPVVAAMACDDPRRRPMDERARADQAHARFRVPNSDFLGTLALYRTWETETATLSQAKQRKLAKAMYLSFPKMREWRDLTRQLGELAKRLGLSFAEAPSTARHTPAQEIDFFALFHRSLLAGLLGRIGHFDEEEHDYRGAHGLRFALHPGSALARTLKKDSRRKTQDAKSPDWIVAGELVDTTQLFARHAAVIDVRWLEQVAGPICRHSYHSPEWDERSGFVRATEQVTLYGLVIVPARRCDYSRIDPVLAREIFIRFGLVDGAFPRPPSEVRANTALLNDLRRHAERTRHPEFFDPARLLDRFQRTIPADICSADALRKWLRLASPAEKTPFILRKADIWPRGTAAECDFPDSLRIAGARLALTYRHTPDNPETDGLTCTVRAEDEGVLKLWRSDWLVPGLLGEKLLWMLGTLPSALRRVLAPLDEAVAILRPLLHPGDLSLEDAVRAAVNERWGFRIPAGVWDWSKLPPHLRVHIRIVGATRKTANRHSDTARPAHATDWTFGDIPAQKTDRNAGWETTSYPALFDEGDGVTLRLFPKRHHAEEAHTAGVTRLLTLALAPSCTVPFRRNRIGLDASLYLKSIDYADETVANDLLAGAIRETLVRNRPPVRDRTTFDARLGEDRAALVRTQAEMTQLLVDACTAAAKVTALLGDERIPEPTADSVTTQLAWLIFRGFPRTVSLATLRHYARYLKGARIRLERARLTPSADLARETKFAPYWERYLELVKDRAKYDGAALDTFRWMLEEYRVSLFAQELHTPEPVSPKRLDAQLMLLGYGVFTP